MPRLSPSNDRSSKKLIISNARVFHSAARSPPIPFRDILSRKLACKRLIKRRCPQPRLRFFAKFVRFLTPKPGNLSIVTRIILRLAALADVLQGVSVLITIGGVCAIISSSNFAIRSGRTLSKHAFRSKTNYARPFTPAVEKYSQRRTRVHSAAYTYISTHRFKIPFQSRFARRMTRSHLDS